MVVSGPQTEHVMDQRIIQILSDSFTQLLIPGICVTIPLTLISFAIGLVVAVAIALIRTAKTPVLEPLARIYVWIFRGTPALVQLFVIFFGLPSIGIVIDAFPSAVIAFRSMWAPMLLRPCVLPSAQCLRGSSKPGSASA